MIVESMFCSSAYNRSGTSSLPTMLVLLPTPKEPCSTWHPALQRLPSSVYRLEVSVKETET